MKNIILMSILAFFTVLTACDKEDDPKKVEITQKWELVGFLADPGDGSIIFQATTSDKTITFFDNNTYESNGSICYLSDNTDSSSSGTYNPELNTITPDSSSCNSSRSITYRLSDTSIAISYQCIERCEELYHPVD